MAEKYVPPHLRNKDGSICMSHARRLVKEESDSLARRRIFVRKPRLRIDSQGNIDFESPPEQNKASRPASSRPIPHARENTLHPNPSIPHVPTGPFNPSGACRQNAKASYYHVRNNQNSGIKKRKSAFDMCVQRPGPIISFADLVLPSIRPWHTGSKLHYASHHSSRANSPSNLYREPPAPRPDPYLVSVNDISAHFGLERGHTRHTLNASAGQPKELMFILLFRGTFKKANNRWISGGIVYAKTNLELLPGYFDTPDGAVREKHLSTTDDSDEVHSVSDLIDLRSQSQSPASSRSEEVCTASTPKSTPQTRSGVDTTTQPTETSSTQNQQDFPPIAVFLQTHASHCPNNRVFKFTGWYEVAEIDFYDPQTPELAAMLGRKWMEPDRHGRNTLKPRYRRAYWEGFKHEWAEVRLVRHEEADAERGGLRVPRLESKCL